MADIRSATGVSYATIYGMIHDEGAALRDPTKWVARRSL